MAKDSFFTLFFGGFGFGVGFILDRPTYKSSVNEYVVNICRESRFWKFDDQGKVVYKKMRDGICSSGYREISKNYAVVGNNVYWVRRVEYSSPACVRSGDPIQGLLNLFSWNCWIANPNKVYRHENRELNLVEKYTPDFRVLNAGDSALSGWQREQVEQYSVNDSSVFLRSKRMDGAEPKSFSPIFPFGEEKWNRFFFSKSQGSTFVGGRVAPDLRIEGFRVLEPTQCPGHGLQCTSDYTLDGDHGYWGYRGILGKTGSDIAYLSWDGAIVFRGLAGKDTFMFMTAKHMYLFSKGRFYEVVVGGSDSTVAALVDMDIAAYKNGTHQ